MLLEFRSLDSLLANCNKRIDLIKIDVDGFDLEVLLGATEIIKLNEPSNCGGT